jgi:hypothetical protein
MSEKNIFKDESKQIKVKAKIIKKNETIDFKTL